MFKYSNRHPAIVPANLYHASRTLPTKAGTRHEEVYVTASDLSAASRLAAQILGAEPKVIAFLGFVHTEVQQS